MAIEPLKLPIPLPAGSPLAAIGFLIIFWFVSLFPLLFGRLLVLFNPLPGPRQDAPQLETPATDAPGNARPIARYGFWILILITLYIIFFVAIELTRDIDLLVQAFVSGSAFWIILFGILAVLYWRKTKDLKNPDIVPADRLRGYFFSSMAVCIVGYWGILILYHQGSRLEIPFLLAVTTLFSTALVRSAFRT
jgi:hypothetical protein